MMLIASASCSEKDPTAPQPTNGIIRITVHTAGGDFDDFYDVLVGGNRTRINANSSVDVTAPVGAVSVELADIAPNCLVAGANPRSVNVAGGVTPVDVAFDIDCAETGVRVRMQATGVDIPVAFLVAVGSRSPVLLPPNGSVLVSRLSAGTTTVSLMLLPDHCTISGSLDVQAQITNRQVTELSFSVQCTTLTRPEKIAFTSDGVINSNQIQSSVMIMNPDGSGLGELQIGRSPEWSHDGKRLVYSTTQCDYYSYNCSGGANIIDPELNSVVPLPGVYGYSFSWSPIDDVIAYGNAQTGQLSFVNSLGNDRRSVSVPNVFWVEHPSWSPDGARLAMTCGLSGGTDICLVNRDGEGLTIINTPGVFEYDAAWSPDGGRIAFTAYGNSSTTTIRIARPDGTNMVELTAGFDPAWSRDGTRIVFARVGGLYIINADGTGEKRITTGSHYSPAWRP